MHQSKVFEFIIRAVSYYLNKLHQPCIYGLHQIFQLHSVLDVDRMLAKSSKDIQPPGSRQSQEAESGHPVIRTLYDHFEVIICSKVPFQRHEHEKCAMIYSYMAMHSLVLTKTNKSNCSKEMKEQKKKICCLFYLLNSVF